MSIWREEKRINRLLLYLTGGLVLGETMALFITAEQGIFGLAVMLSVFSCVLWHGFKHMRREGKDRGGLPVLFGVPLLGIGIMVLGWSAGFLRMEQERAGFLRKEQAAGAWEDTEAAVSGTVAEITESGDGVRLLLKGCRMKEREAETYRGDQRIGRLYCYVGSEEEKAVKVGMKILVSGKGKAPEPARNPGAFDYRLFCRSRGVGGILYGEETEILDSRYSRFFEGARELRMVLERQLDKISAEPDTGILKAVLLGNKSGMDDGIYELYRKNGISHLLAISGLHVSIIGMSLWKGLRKCGLGYAGAGALAWGFLMVYGVMTGFGPSVVRAVFMAGISFLAAGLGRTYDLPSAMCVPALGLLISYPYLLTQASFQLSFLAVGAVFFPGGYLIKKWKAQGIFKALIISASIQAVTAPVILFHSFELPAYGIVLNLVVIPLMAYAAVSGVLGIGMSFVSVRAGILSLGGAHYILDFYKRICEAVLRLPGSSLLLGRPHWWQMAVFYGGMLAGLWLLEREEKGGGRKRSMGAAAFVWMCSFLFLIPVSGPGLSVTFLDVGQGDGIVLRYRDKTMLVDCGSSQVKKIGEECLVPYLKSQGIRRLDLVVVSHGDADHINGIRYLMESPEWGDRIGMVVMPEAGKGEEVYESLEALAGERGIPVSYGKRGDELTGIFGEKGRILCLHPQEGSSYADRNEESLVLFVQYGEFKLLLTGDVESLGEEEILKSCGSLQAAVLKAAHHGSDTSSGEAFIEAVNPEYAVLSYGRRNRYGHPAKEVVERLQNHGVRILETARQGAIRIRTDGKRMKAEGYLRR